MNKRFQTLALVLSMIMVFSISNAAEITKISAPEYHFSFRPSSNTSDDEKADAIVRGESCDNLNGTLYSPDAKNDVWYDGLLYCLPNVRNIRPYLAEGAQYIDSTTIKLVSGLYLIKMSEPALSREEYFLDVLKRTSGNGPEHQKILENKFAEIPTTARLISGRFYDISHIEECGDRDDNIFCAIIDIYDPEPRQNKMFKVFCWDCERIGSSPESLLDSFLFYQSGYGLLSDGGIAFEFDSIASKHIPRLQAILNLQKGEKNG